MKMMHITIHTARLDESIAFYRNVLGLEVRRDMRQTVGAPIVFLSGGEGEVCVELIADPEQAYRGEGLSIGFHVDDVDQTHARMTELGLRPSTIISPGPEVRFFYIQDPNGVSIQLI